MSASFDDRKERKKAGGEREMEREVAFFSQSSLGKLATGINEKNKKGEGQRETLHFF